MDNHKDRQRRRVRWRYPGHRLDAGNDAGRQRPHGRIRQSSGVVGNRIRCSDAWVELVGGRIVLLLIGPLRNRHPPGAFSLVGVPVGAFYWSRAVARQAVPAGAVGAVLGAFSSRFRPFLAVFSAIQNGKEKPRNSLESRGLRMVAGLGFEPRTFRL